MLLLLFLTAPVLYRLARRWPLATVATLTVATLVLEVVDNRTHWTPTWAPDLVWKTGDYLLYAAFFAAGIAQHKNRGRAAVSARQYLAASGGLGALGVIWAVASPPQDGVVNNSHAVHINTNSPDT